MALIFCPECGTQVSDQAKQCNKCGYPIEMISNRNYNSNQTNNTFNQSTNNNSFNIPKEEVVIDNTIVWILAFAPIIGGILQGFIVGLIYQDDWVQHFNSFWWVTLAINAALCVADESKLKKEGIDTSYFGGGWMLLIPVYLYRRATQLKQNYSPFWIWILVCILYNYGII